MGRSVSCFKIITCAGDSPDNDDLQASENKGSSEKSRWSFRKRSARHRVLSNTVITESAYSANKGTSNSATLDFQSLDPSTVPEKISLIHCTDEKAHLPTSVELKASETSVVAEVNSEKDEQLQESVVIVVQTAVRGFLAQKELLKLKNLVKMQAAVRGHLVRRHAIGTLRCVQAIVRIQALYRARQTRLLQEAEKKIDGKNVKANSKISGKGNSIERPTYISLNKLLSNKFARQLMESTPKERPIYIDCDPAKPSSAWNWFERWMSVSSAEPTPHPEPRTEQEEREHNDYMALKEEIVVPSAGSTETADSESRAKENHLPSLTNEDSVTYDKGNFMSQQSHFSNALAKDDLEMPNSGKIATSDVEEPSTGLDSLPAQNMEPDVKPQTESTSVPQKEEVEGERTDQPKRSMKRNASDSLETLEAEGKKFVSGSRKVSNPSFLAAHSKFEQRSSTTNSSQPLSSSNQDGGVEPNIETVSSGPNTALRTNDLNSMDGSLPNNLSGRHGDSECGTELSVTSTLDSPDVSEVGVAEPEYEQEVKYPEKETCGPDIREDVAVTENVSSDQVPELPESVTIEPEKLDVESANSVIAAESAVIEKPERSTSDVQREMDFKTGGSQYRTSPEASLSSHITVPESLGTPSSELSVSNKKNRSKSGSNQKRKTLSAAKGSPFNLNNDSGVKDSVEQLAKDQKNGKRRNSFGSSRADQTDQEPRDSSSSSSNVPRFMQATESARAKLQDNMSPRSSPDVQDREYVKKRHSLPGANGRQGSPRVKRSMSQAQPGSNANGSMVVHEKKWQR